MWPFCPQIGPKVGALGGLQGQYWVFEGPGPFGSPNNAKKSSGTLSDPIGALTGSQCVHLIILEVPKPLRNQ